MRIISKYWKILLTVLFGVAVALFWAIPYMSVLSFQEQYQLFLFDGHYFLERVAVPGGLACYVAEFITQFNYIPVLGACLLALVYVLGILKSACYAPTIPLLWAMIADVADDMEYRNHRRATGFCFSGIVFALKMGLGLGGALAGVVISCFGYQSGGVVVQTASAAYGIRLVSSLIPALLLVVGVVVLSRYPITKKYNENMQAELAARRNAARRN